MRIEKDSLGEKQVPEEALYGIQTVRAIENFAFSGIKIRDFYHFVCGLVLVKKAAAEANFRLGVLEEKKAKAIIAACDEILAGKHHEEFVVDMFQGGAGTSTNMCANEVIANRALEILGHNRGEYQFLHPNDDVNCSQSTNDAYPTAIKIATLRYIKDALGAMSELHEALIEKSREFADVIKMGRTENQDAVPMTLGQEFKAYAVMIEGAEKALGKVTHELMEINLGATAIGTGLNAPEGYAELAAEILGEISGLPLKLAQDLVEATQDSGEFVQVSATTKRVAVQISKICNDLRWLSSGPKCGLNEINLPPRQPGSSIMPGKVNPVIPEAVNQICYQLIGIDATISMASEASELELNMAEPLIAFNMFFGLTLLKNACRALARKCIKGITANRDICRQYVVNSYGMVTALSPILGYEKCSLIVKEAMATGESIYDLVLAKEWLSKEKLDELLDINSVIPPRRPRRRE
jgi:aspartate ammonia-lyase